jgi:hypothetical protein|tara:strand:+ start:375 stop:593 length:219 start_codon:yes stop_codon:yes gene_type:complete
MSKELEIFRDYRNMLLRQSDWTVMTDSPISESKQSEWKKYRQALRDLTKTANPKLIGARLDLSSVTFPEKPS